MFDTSKYDDSNPANSVLTWRFIWSHPAHAVATFFGAGLPRKAPGTYGTLAGALAYIVLSPSIPLTGWLILCAAFFLAGIWASDRMANDLGVEDHHGIVIDEVVAIWLLYMFIPTGPIWWILGFIAFRFFDIVKLPPVDIIDKKMKNGLGVMVDDLFAAFYAWVPLSLIAWFF